MGVVGKLKGEGVLSGGELDLGFGLAFPKVDVLFVGGNGFAGFDGFAVDNDVMMAGVGDIFAGGVDGHAFYSHFNFDRALDGRAVF